MSQNVLRLVVGIAVFLSFGFSAGADVGVSSGNALGESNSVPAAGQVVVPLPDIPSGLIATLIGANKVHLTWSGQLDAGKFDKFRIFRAIDDQPWVAVADLSASEYEDTADPDHSYRYKAAVYGKRDTAYSFFVTGPPSNEVAIGHATVTMSAGARMSFPPTTPAPSGNFTVSKFLPDSAGAANPPPDSFTLDGPFSSGRELEPGTRWQHFLEVGGVLPAGESLGASAYVDTQNLYKDPFAELGTEWASYGFVPPFPVTWSGAGPILSGNSQFGLFSAQFAGDPSLGFDAISNPKWQMLPNGGSREVAIDVKPDVGTDSVQLLFAADEGFASHSVAPGTTVVDFQGGPVAREAKVRNFTIHATLGLDARAQQTITVGVFRVRYSWPHPTIPNLTVYGIMPSVPTEQEIEAGLDAVYGSQANIRFEVTVEPGVIEYSRNEEVIVDGAVDIESTEKNRFAAITAATGYRFCVFAFRFGSFRYKQLSPFALGGVANRIPGEFAFVGSSNLVLWAHEIGHLLGLDHPFLESVEWSTSRVPDHWRQRLMGYDRSAFRFIKGERDLIHLNAPRPPPSGNP